MGSSVLTFIVVFIVLGSIAHWKKRKQPASTQSNDVNLDITFISEGDGQEKVLAHGSAKNTKDVLKYFVVGLLILGCVFYLYLIFLLSWDSDYYDSFFEALIANADNTIPLLIGLVPIGVSIILFFIRAWVGKMEIVVTDKRVYGTNASGDRVDLPIDSVSAVGSCVCNGISVSSSSGKISFLLIDNRDKIHQVISDLLIERQNKQPGTATIIQEMPQSSADELKKFKDLFDAGIITEEEFNAKKNQLLGL